MTVQHGTIKIRAGKYQYRGVIVCKLGNRFCATALAQRGWFHLGNSTLKQALWYIDKYIDKYGWQVENGYIKDPKRFF